VPLSSQATTITRADIATGTLKHILSNGRSRRAIDGLVPALSLDYILGIPLDIEWAFVYYPHGGFMRRCSQCLLCVNSIRIEMVVIDYPGHSADYDQSPD